MSLFTTRPEIRGSFGVATSTHWIASSVGFGILEKDGNAFDAAVAMGFVLQIVEPHLCGPAGDAPMIFHSAKTGKIEVLCGQGTAPAGATIEAYRAQGLDLIPGSGLLATVIPGAFDAWMVMLRDHGTISLREALEPAIYYAEQGHPMLGRVADTIADLGDFFKEEWPTSYETWLPGGQAPKAGKLFRNPALATTWKRIVEEAESKSGREAQIDAARDAFYRGFVAEAMDGYLRTAEVMDASGEKHGGVLTGEDMAGWQASYDTPLTLDYQDWTVAKANSWTQGPVLLQSLALLKGFDISSMDPAGADFVHLVVEAMKLAYADREAYYGDPDFVDVPMEHLLSEAYNSERRKLIGDRASLEQRPGIVPGFEEQVKRGLEMQSSIDTSVGGVGAGEPTMAHLSDRKGDTVHIDVIDRHGNMVSATPSGGWLQSSPVIPGLGMPLNSRAQMFWLTPGLPSSLAPGKRPRTTLTPSLALHKGRPSLVFGTPGGDQQDQWQLTFFLRHVHHNLNLQECIDAPLFHSMHFPSSFYPRAAAPGHIMVEENIGAEVLADLEARGHIVTAAPEWSVGRLTAAKKDEDGLLRAAATPRLMQAYAVGR